MTEPRIYLRCMVCRRRVMTPRWWVGDIIACDACSKRSPTQAIAASIWHGTYPRRHR